MRPPARSADRAYLLAWRHEHGRHYASIWHLRRRQQLVLGVVAAAGTLGVLAPNETVPTESAQVAAQVYPTSTPHVPFVVAQVEDVHLTTWRRPFAIVARDVVSTTVSQRDDARLSTVSVGSRVVVASPTTTKVPVRVTSTPSSTRTVDVVHPSGSSTPTHTVVTSTSSPTVVPSTVVSPTVVPTMDPPTPTSTPTPTPTPGATTDAATTDPTPSPTSTADGTSSGSPTGTP